MIGDIHSIATVVRMYGRYLIGVRNAKIIVGIKDEQTGQEADWEIFLLLRKFNPLFPDYPRYYVYGKQEFDDYFQN